MSLVYTLCRLGVLFIVLFFIGTSHATITAPQIDGNGKLILPNPTLLPKLPTDAEAFFKQNNAYEYGARLYIQGVGETDRTHGHTLYSQRAYNEIQSVLGHTPRWDNWAEKIKEQMAAESGIQIVGQLTTNGIQTEGDYSGSVALFVISDASRDSTKQTAFTAILPEINARNYFVDQMANLNLSPQDRAWLHQAYLHRREQAQPNEGRTSNNSNPDNQNRLSQNRNDDTLSRHSRQDNFGDIAYENAVGDITPPKAIDDLINANVNVEPEIGYTAALGVVGKVTSGYAIDTNANVCKTDTICVGIGPMVEVSVNASIHGNTGMLTENSSSWSVTTIGGEPTVGYSLGFSGAIGTDSSMSGGGEGKVGFGAGKAVLVCQKEVSECQKVDLNLK